MTTAAHLLQAPTTVTVHMSHIQTTSTTIRKTAIMAAKIIGLLTAGIGIGYLIAIKTVKSGSCSENPLLTTNSPDDAFWDGCCRPLFDFIGCLGEKVPNFSSALDQCPTSSDCDP